MKSITLCFFSLFLTLSLIGQECGTHVHEHDRERISRDFAQFHQNIGNYMPSFSRSNPTTPDIIVIKPHLVVDPATGVTPWGINDAANINTILAIANQYFSTINVQFVLDNRAYIADASLWNVTNAVDRANFLPHSTSYPNSINVFFTNSLSGDGGFSSQIPPFTYLYGGSFIGMTYTDAMVGNKTLLTHELGHFFGLLHTFEKGKGYEKINGSNCLTSGDLICDTPADNYTDVIKTQINVNTCTYTGTEKQCADNLGFQYNPPVDNIMTYWSTYTCNNVFTPQQYARMNYTKEKYLGYLYKGNDVWAMVEKPTYACDMNNTVNFTTESHNVASYQWTFSGGTPSTSTSASPSITYTNSGNYDVTLTVTGINGSSYTITETNYVDIKERNSISDANVSALDFENNTLGNWTTESNEDNACGSWQIIPISGTYGNALRLSTIAIKEGRRYDFKSPFIQFQNYAQLQLSFDYAYSPSIGASGVRYDILQVVFLSACGQESILAQKTGTDLSTVANGSNIQFYPNSSEWAGENIDLLSLPTFPTNTDWGQIIIRVHSFNGNSLYLDNIKLQGQVPNVAYGLDADYNSMLHYADLVWVDNSQVESGYVVERQDDLGNFYTIATLPPNTTTYSDIGLLPSTTHYYRVRAIINGSPFTPSDSTSIHTFPLPSPPVLTISGSGSQANLSFTIPGQAIGSLTEIYYTADGGGLSQIASLPIIAMGYGHTGLPSNMVHHYAAKHRQGYFSSAFSNQVTYSTATAASDPIVAIEYFIDSEPGIGNGIAVSVGAGTDISHAFSPVISGLNEGFHVLGVRVKTSANKWSETVHSVFFKTTGGSSTLNDGIVEIEYFINNDPGNGNATTITVTPNIGEEYAINMDLNGVPNGINICGIRTKDVFGNWSATAYSTFFKTDGFAANEVRIEQFEYFVDDEPGVGLGTPINVSPSVDGTYVLNIDLNGISNGLHSLGMRSRDELGNWSATAYSTFFKTDGTIANNNQIVKFEYFINNDPGIGNAISINVSGAVDDTYLLNIDLNGLPNGIYTLGLRSQDENGFWSQTTISTFTKPYDFLAPLLTLSSSTIAASNNLIISGQDFTPNDNAKLRFYGAGGLSDVTVSCNAQGGFTYTHTVSSTPDMSQGGLSGVRGVDLASNQQSSAKVFYITQPTAASVSYLSLIAPQQGDSYEVNRIFNITFQDKMQRQYNGMNYPMKGNTAERMYQYEISYQEGAGNPWQVFTTITGSAFLNSDITKTITMVLPNVNSAYNIRVKDVYQNTIISESGTFALIPVGGGVQADLVWDYSFPKPNVAVKGVAADGVSRIYIRLKKAVGATNNIQSATVSLSDGTNNTTEMLGKVQAATETRKYSTEANGANQLTATAMADVNGDIWIWYVAPDDFSQTDAAPHGLKSQRTVTATINVTMANGSTVTKTVDIMVVRPPLMMVHGLNGDESSFANFRHSAGIGEMTFVNSSLFKQRNAVNMKPNASFLENANTLLSPDCGGCGVSISSSNYENTLQGNVDMLRQQGYASNQVDYVCHSMGGLMLRTAMTEFHDKFYGTGFSANSPYKNYEKGFVHKLITINSPHGGSPIADMISEFIPQLSPMLQRSLTGLYLVSPNNGHRFDVGIWNFITPIDRSNPDMYQFGPSPAVSDLRIDGGPALDAVNVRHHYIVGDVDWINDGTAATISAIPEFTNMIEDFKVIDHLYLSALLGNYFSSVYLTVTGVGITGAVRGAIFLEDYSENKGYPNFLGNSDLIVPVASQLSLPASSSVPTGVPSVLPINTTDFTGFSANHLFIVDRLDVGNRVKELLNTPVSSNLFGATIQAVPKISSGSGNAVANNAGVLRSPNAQSIPPTTITYVDTSKIVLISPLRNSIVMVDSAFTFKYQLKDTVNLLYTNYLFQTNSDISVDTVLLHTVTLQAEPSMLGQQTIWVTAVYIDTAGVVTHYADSLSVIVQTNQTISAFNVSQRNVTLYKGGTHAPSYTAFYPTFIANVPINNSELSVSIANPSIISFSDNEFKAIDTLSTFAVVSYKGFTDTIYFNVLDSNIVDFQCDVQITLDSLIPATDGINDGKISFSLNSTTDMVIEWLDSTNLSSLTRENLAPGTYTMIATNAYTLCSDIHAVSVMAEVLPVELLYFTGEVTESGNLLNWATASENNNKGFSVQRSLNDGKDWQTLGFVDGNGTTSEIHQYEYLDESPALGLNYYRLEQVDFDDKTSFSNIVVLKNTRTTELKIELNPNPTTTNSNVTLKIEGEAIGEITCEIISVSGQVLKTVKIEHSTNQSTHQIETPAISGTYILRLKNNERVLESLRFMVN